MDKSYIEELLCDLNQQDFLASQIVKLSRREFAKTRLILVNLLKETESSLRLSFCEALLRKSGGRGKDLQSVASRSWMIAQDFLEAASKEASAPMKEIKTDIDIIKEVGIEAGCSCKGFVVLGTLGLYPPPSMYKSDAEGDFDESFKKQQTFSRIYRKKIDYFESLNKGEGLFEVLDKDVPAYRTWQKNDFKPYIPYLAAFYYRRLKELELVEVEPCMFPDGFPKDQFLKEKNITPRNSRNSGITIEKSFKWKFIECGHEYEYEQSRSVAGLNCHFRKYN